MSNNQPTAAILIIGNEILSGRTQDLNVQFIANKLSDIGIILVEVHMVQDDEDQIVDSVNVLRKKHKYVFTTGGIGPTHDDITAPSIAKAFGVSLKRSAEAFDMIKRHLKKKGKVIKNESAVMADVPVGAELIKNSLSGCPGFNIENVYVLAGIPDIVKSMFENIEEELERGEKFISKNIKVFIGESAIKDILQNAQDKYDKLQFGSYPFRENEEWGTVMVVRGQNPIDIEEAFLELKKELKKYGINFSEV
ncbi:MAG: competence/damage-inducible protein A [Alphaproteobacteria bacterium]|nr:competence/damage-inducible protein A [Alphaproteobacteria bacterium]